jgi:hypothetical protein
MSEKLSESCREFVEFFSLVLSENEIKQIFVVSEEG